MDRRKTLVALGGVGASLLLPACGGGGSTPPAVDAGASASLDGGVKPLGMALPDPLEVATRLRAYVDYGNKPLPTKIDNSDRCPPIGNQGNLGSCTAWATGYGLASYAAGSVGRYTPSTADKQGSPADMYAKLLRLERSSCENGTRVRDALDILCREGIATHASSPYSDRSCSAPSASANFRITSYLSFAPNDAIGIKRQLATGNVLAIGSLIKEEIFSISNQTYYGRTGKALGGHAMLVVGYDDAKSAYKVMNSWGAQWGAGGYFWFDYDAFARDTHEAVAAVLQPPKPISNASPTVVSTIGSSIQDTFYKKDFLYVFVEFSNMWTVQSYRITAAGNLVGERSGFSQTVGATQFVLDKPSDDAGYPPQVYSIELKGVDVLGKTVTLKSNVFVLQFVAATSKEPS